MSPELPAVGSGFLAAARDADRRVRRILVAGIAVSVIFVGGFGLWAAFAPIGSAAVASGHVAISGNRKTVQHLGGGIVRAILVKDGDIVHAGDLLVELDDTEARASATLLANRLAAFQADQARLKAELADAPALSFPPELLIAARTAPQIADILRGQQNLFDSRKAYIEGQSAVLRQRRRQLAEQMQGSRAQVAAADNQLKLMEDELAGLRQLLASGLAPKNRVRALEREEARIAGQKAETGANIAAAEVRLGETELQLLQLVADRHQEASEALKDVESKLSDTAQSALAAEATLARTRITAPLDGTIVNLAVHTLGGVVAPGAALMDIVPLNEDLIVEAQLPPTEIDNVQIGTEAEIRFPAFAQRYVPVILGTTIDLSADALTDSTGERSWYVARIAVKSDRLPELEDRRLVPGMPAEVIFAARNTTLLAYLLNPVSSLLATAFPER
jgi:HlyD family type I secretion membrane fusion protein